MAGTSIYKGMVSADPKAVWCVSINCLLIVDHFMFNNFVMVSTMLVKMCILCSFLFGNGIIIIILIHNDQKQTQTSTEQQ